MDVADALVAVFEDVDHRIEQIVDSLVVAGLDRDHRHTHHASQAVVVQPGAAGLQFVEHVQRHDHPGVDIDQFGREVEVSLDVRGDDGVDHHVGGPRSEVVAHVTLLGGVGREGIGPGQVRDFEAVAAVEAVAALGPDRHAAVVADMLVPARNGVEERGFAAVGVSDQRHGDRAALPGEDLLDRRTLLLSGGGFLRGQREAFGLLRRSCGSLPDAFGPACEVLVGLGIGEHLDHFGLAAAQRDVIAHDPVFDGVLERRVENHLDTLSADEPHLHDAAPEPAVSHDLDDCGGLAALEFGKTHFSDFNLASKNTILFRHGQSLHVGISARPWASGFRVCGSGQRATAGTERPVGPGHPGRRAVFGGSGGPKSGSEVPQSDFFVEKRCVFRASKDDV